MIAPPSSTLPADNPVIKVGPKSLVFARKMPPLKLNVLKTLLACPTWRTFNTPPGSRFAMQTSAGELAALPSSWNLSPVLGEVCGITVSVPARSRMLVAPAASPLSPTRKLAVAELERVTDAPLVMMQYDNPLGTLH